MPQWIRAVPGFRTDTRWKQCVAVASYLVLAALVIFGPFQHKVLAAVVLAALGLATNTGGLRRQVPAFRSGDKVKAGLAWAGLLLIGLVSLKSVAGPGEPTQPQVAPSFAGATIEKSAQTESAAPPFNQEEADEHLANAQDYLASGDLGLGLAEISQALAVAPGYQAASSLQTEVRAQATSVAREAVAQATAQTQAARAEATAQTQAARAEATAQAQADAKARLDSLSKEFASILDAGNRAGGSRFFVRSEVKLSGNRVEVVISDLWYRTPRFQQERWVDLIADGYAGLAAKYGITGYPTTSFVDTFGKEVAFKSSLRGTIIN